MGKKPLIALGIEGSGENWAEYPLSALMNEG